MRGARRRSRYCVLMITLPTAHAGHWLVDLLYVAPVLAVVAWIGGKALLDRRRDPR